MQMCGWSLVLVLHLNHQQQRYFTGFLLLSLNILRPSLSLHFIFPTLFSKLIRPSWVLAQRSPEACNWPRLGMNLFAGFLRLRRPSQPMARSLLLRRAYFVEDPVASSFPKPQRSRSQVHNCSLNQSANFVVSVLQTVGLKSSIHTRTVCPRPLFRVAENLRASLKIQRRCIQLWLCGLHTFSIKPSTTCPICSVFMGIIVLLWLCWRGGPHS